jgi:hypothetical protein
MGNPAEKTIRNPNLKQLLFKGCVRVNKKFYFDGSFFFEARKSVKLYNIVYSQVLIHKGSCEP